MSRAERSISKYMGPRYIKENLRWQFVFNRNIFDKTLSKVEREYNHKVVSEIEKVSTSNTRDLESHIK